MKVLDNSCPSCGAKITFNPKNQSWDCEYCGSKFTLEQMQEYENASSIEANQQQEIKKIDNMDLYHCKNCGAQLLTDKNTTATFCVYCGSSAILKEKIDQGLIPTKILPFKKVKEDAINAFKGIAKKRPLMPKLFNKTENIEKITGVYIPFWCYDLKVEGSIDFDAKDVTTWSTHDTMYVKTDIFLVKRQADVEFDNILVDASTRFDDDLMDSLEPFDLNELVDYNHAYLAGFLAEKYDVEIDQAINHANQRAMNSCVGLARNSVHHQSISVKNNELKVNKMSGDYILLPVWMVSINYRDKDYIFALNGQTGSLIGNIPIDITKSIIIASALFVGIAIIIFLILWFI